MKINWRERITLEPSFAQLATWAHMSPDELPAHQRKPYVRNRRIVASILAGVTVKRVAIENNVSPGRVSQVMARTLGGDSLSPPALANGLLPYKNVTRSIRRSPLPTVTDPLGSSCAFKQLLCEVPGLDASLDNMLVAKLRDKSHAQTPSPQRFHAEFKRFLVANNWPSDAYPFSTINCGYETVRQYYHQRMEWLRAKIEQKRQRHFSEKSMPSSNYAGRMIQVDEQKVDLHVSIYLDINGIKLPIPLPRISILLAIDVDTLCVLNYSLVLSASPNEEDILELLQGCITPATLPKLTAPHLSYTPGANFPRTVSDSQGLQFGTVQLDNAWAHHSRAVVDWICNKMGATVHFGLPKHPTVRPLVEHLFHHINQKVSHRPASTTGSHPRDSIKASSKEYKKVPIVTFQHLDEMLCVTLSNYNVEPHPSLASSTPLNAYLASITQQSCLTLPDQVRADLSVNLNNRDVSVKKATGQQRAPYINFCYGKYYGECLDSSLIQNNRIMIKYDYRDIRFLQAYLPSGEYLGQLKVSKSWRRFAHSLKLRQKIHKDVRKHRFHAQDKLAGYFNFLLENNTKSENKIKIARLHQSFTEGRFLPLNTHESPLELPDIQSVSHPNEMTAERSTKGKRSNKGKFKWSKSSASHHTVEESPNER